MTVCVQRAAGAQTALSHATVKMVRPALLMKEPVSVHQDTEAPPARGVRTSSVPQNIRTVLLDLKSNSDKLCFVYSLLTRLFWPPLQSDLSTVCPQEWTVPPHYRTV